MKYFKINTFEVSSLGSYWSYYYSCGETLEEAKAKLVKKVGCTPSYFAEGEYTRSEEVECTDEVIAELQETFGLYE